MHLNKSKNNFSNSNILNASEQPTYAATLNDSNFKKWIIRVLYI